MRFLLTLTLVVVVVFFAATVPLGKRTFFGHVQAIWSTPEAKDMRDGVGDKAGPVVKKLERGVKAGVREATRDEPGTGTARPAVDAGVRDAR